MMEELSNRYLAGEAIAALARESGIPYGTLRQRLVKLGKPHRRRGQHDPISTHDRFITKFQPEPNSGCWLWLGHTDANGYGRFWVQGQKTTAQRAAWFLFRCDIPVGMEVDHLCRTPSCVNPDHLRVVTKSINLNARQLAKDKCRNGHALTDDNVYFERGGRVRRCKKCRKLSRQQSKE